MSVNFFKPNLSMKPFFLTCAILAGLSLACSAQTSSPARELGIQFTNLDFNTFGLIFKKQRSENRYMRYRAVFTRLNADFVEGGTNLSLGLGGRVGFERRKALNDRTYFLFGPELGAGINLIANEGAQGTPYNLNASIGYVLGVHHNFGEHFFVNLETVPGLSVTYIDPGTHDRDDSLLRANLGFESVAAISVGIRF
jgi:hypothetical protein